MRPPVLVAPCPMQRLYGCFLVACMVGLAACQSDEPTESMTECLDDRAFFEEKVYGQVLLPTCMGCHTAEGAARDSAMVFVTSAQPDHLEVNRATLTNVAGLSRNGTSIVLLKPIGDEDHEGGAVINAESSDYQVLTEFVARLATPVVCENNDLVKEVGLEVLSPASTLRKASLALTGSLPTASQFETVRFGGDEALDAAIENLMAGDAFIERIKELYNDRLLTDRYLAGSSAIGIVDYDRYPNLYWYDSIENDTDRGTMRNILNDSIAREPLELIGHLLRERRPFTEILTADYTMLNAFSAKSMGIAGLEPTLDDPQGLTYHPVQLEGVPHAGVLTTTAFLNRFPTTPTNRNRHRARIFYDRFLATDILSFADRPIDPTISSTHNPTLNDPQCTVCHDTLDPVAGAFQNWDDDGHFNPLEEGWYPEMAIPGFSDSFLPFDETPTALQWLAAKTVLDARFSLATAQTIFRGLTGLEVLTDKGTQHDEVRHDAYKAQHAFLTEAAQIFVDNHYELRALIKAVVTSHYFRAVKQNEASEEDLVLAGTAHLLTPEELTRKIQAVTGYPWRERVDRVDYLLERYRMLYGGIDSNAVIDRLKEPNGIMANIGMRMATDVACRTTALDFVLAPEQRRLFPYVEPTYEPETVDGFEIPVVENLIRENLRYLHARVLGEELTLEDPEIDATYAFFYETWKEGKAKIASGETLDYLTWRCRARQDFWTQEALPADLEIRYDRLYTIRAWMATMTYLLSDYRFFYE